MSDTDNPRAAFIKSLPRKIVEIKATLGAFIADPRSTRMRDELRRRLGALLALTRSHDLQSLCDALSAAEELLDPARSNFPLQPAEVQLLTSHIASLSALAGIVRPQQGARVGSSHTLQGFSRPPQTSALVPIATLPPPPNPTSELSPSAAASTPAPVASSRMVTSRPYSPASSPFAAAQSVLFVGGSLLCATLRSALPADMDLLPTDNLADAMLLARDTSPDVVVAEVDPPADGVSLLSALRADPLTDFLPVILLADDIESTEALRARCPEASDVLSIGTDALVMRAAIERALSGASATEPLSDLGEISLEELSHALADEVRRGLVGVVGTGSRSAKLQLGSGNEVLSATWEAIARIREVVEKLSGGAVRFELTASPRGLPGAHVFSPGDGAPDEDPRAPAFDPLPGRKALVVDDNLDVVTSFAALLTHAGMSVIQCSDGATALQAARESLPDVVIADIVMPGLDGFGLCREIQRDVSLRHTPVILLSWRDDLLTRMRDMGAQAQGYLRKESTGEAILARVRAVLRARVRLLLRVAALGPEGSVRGRIERLGAAALIAEASRALTDATVTLADASSVTELEIRGGSLVAAVRTALDGSLARGDGALAQSLELGAGRFVVRRNNAPARANLRGERAVTSDPIALSLAPSTLSLEVEGEKKQEALAPSVLEDPPESDTLAEAVWRQLRGAVEEHQTNPNDPAETKDSDEPTALPGVIIREITTEPPPPVEVRRVAERTDTLPPPPPTPVGPRVEDPVQVTEVTFDPHRGLTALTAPPVALGGGPVTRRAWIKLGLFVALIFAASYVAVRGYVQHKSGVSSAPVLDLPIDAQPLGQTAEVPSAVGEDAAAEASADIAHTDGAEGGAGEPYADPTPWLDGGSLPPGSGLLVVRAQRRGASEVQVQVDQRAAGNAPLTLTLSEGLHTLRFRAGIITTYQFAHLRAGSAVLIDAPSDH